MLKSIMIDKCQAIDNLKVSADKPSLRVKKMKKRLGDETTYVGKESAVGMRGKRVRG